MQPRGSLAATLLAIAVTLFVAVPAHAASVSVSPTSGPAGSTATFSGSGFSAGAVIQACWGGPSPSCISLGTATAGDEGSFSMGVTIPADTSPGDWTVSACEIQDESPGSCGLAASAFFSVIADSDPTTTTSEATTTTTTTSATTTTTTTPTTTTPSTTTTSTTPTSTSTTTSTTTTTVAATPAAAPPQPSPQPIAPTATPAPPSAADVDTTETTTAAPSSGGVPRVTATAEGEPVVATGASAPSVAPEGTAAEETVPTTLLTASPPEIAGLDLSNPAMFWGLWLVIVAAVGASGGLVWWLISLMRSWRMS